MEETFNYIIDVVFHQTNSLLILILTILLFCQTSLHPVRHPIPSLSLPYPYPYHFFARQPDGGAV